MGGAGGHMRHPHDLNEVEEGADVVNLFRAIPAYLKTKEFQGGASSSLKVDGSNNGLKVVVRNGNYTFAVDRGTQMAADVAGVSLDDMDTRWPEKIDPATGEAKPRGLMGSSIQLVTMMNEALADDRKRSKMVDLLKRLGLLQEDGDPDLSKFIMIEWVERRAFDHPTNPDLGRANVIYYPYNFIAFLGVSQFFEMTNRYGEVTRRSELKAGEEDSGPGKPIPYDREALSELVEMVKDFAPEDFKVLSPISLRVAVGGDVPEEEQETAVTEAVNTLAQSIDATLQEQIPIRLHSGDDRLPTTHTLEEWLGMAENFPYKPDIKIKQMVDGEERIRKVSPFHKDIHKALVYDNVALPDLVVDTEIVEAVRGTLTPSLKALYGAIFIEAARRLGNTVKQSLGSSVEEFGPTVSHEGVVIDAGMKFGDKKTGHPFKITGEFIVDATGGAYAGGQALEENEDADPVVDIEVVDEPAGKLYALVPGSMKPPTLGHVGMIEAYSNMVSGMDPNGEVLVFVSKPTARHPKTQELTSARGFPGRPEGITQTEAIKILRKMLPEEILKPIGNVHLEKTSHASPMHAVFDFVSPKNLEGKQATAGDTVILGASTKGGDQERWDSIINNPEHVRSGVTVESIPVDPVVHQEGYLTLIRSEAARDIMEKLPTVAKEIKKIGGPVPDEAMAEVLSNISASDARHIMGFLETDKREITLQLLDAFFGEHTAAILAELGLSGAVGEEEVVIEPEAELEEISAMGAGAVAGGVGKKKKKSSIIRRENKQTVDDVIRLLMERGIMS